MTFNINEFKQVPAEVALFDSSDFEQHVKKDVKAVDQSFQDADMTAFFERSLLAVMSRTFDTKQQDLRYARFFPVSSEVDPGAKTFAYQGYTAYGSAKAISDYANDFPRADVYGEEKTGNIKSFGVSYGWSVEEIRRSMLSARISGRPFNLSDKRAAAARRAADEVVNTSAFTGYPEYGINGFINYPGITQVVNPTGVGGNTFATKTPDEILKTFAALLNGVSVPTKGKEIPNTVIMPLEQYNHLRYTRLTDTGISLLSYLRDNFPEITLWDWAEELNGAGAAGADRMMAYVRNSANLELHLPLPFTPYTAQVKNLEWVVPCELKTGGVVVYYPLSVSYIDGI